MRAGSVKNLDLPPDHNLGFKGAANEKFVCNEKFGINCDLAEAQFGTWRGIIIKIRITLIVMPGFQRSLPSDQNHCSAESVIQAGTFLLSQCHPAFEALLLVNMLVEGWLVSVCFKQ